MSEHQLDQAPAIAQFVCESSIVAPDGAIMTNIEFLTKVVRQFPTAGVEEFRRATVIANQLLAADRSERGHVAMVNNPCPCGAPGIVVLLGADDQPTGERRCSACDLKEADAEKRPCAKCGKPLKGEDVRAGITLCEPCDPDEIGWYDDEATS